MTSDPNSKAEDVPSDRAIREVPVAWEALEDAFENNASEIHSYLHLDTGDVLRIVDGVADPQMHGRVGKDPAYLRVEPVSSREQYRWMERFIATVDEGELRDKLVQSIDGKGAFRRFKDVLMTFPLDRERWFTFRTERLRACMESWLEAHALKAVERKEWAVPSVEDVQTNVPVETDSAIKRSRVPLTDANRRRLHEMIDILPARELDTALAFLEFLKERRHLPRSRARTDEAESSSELERIESSQAVEASQG